MNATKIGTKNNNYFIKCMVSAYKEKDTTVYMETEYEYDLQVEKLCRFFELAGAGSLDWRRMDDEWEFESKAVLSDIRKSSRKNGFRKVFIGNPFSGATLGEPPRRFSDRCVPRHVKEAWDMLSYHMTEQRP